MEHRILREVLEGKITLEELMSWLEPKVVKTGTTNKIGGLYLTSQGAFVEFVVKFIYEKTAWLLENNHAQSITAKTVISESKRAALFPGKQDSRDETSLGVGALNVLDDNRVSIIGIQTSGLNLSGRVSLNTSSTSQSVISSPSTQAKEWPAVGGRRSQNAADSSETDSSVLNTSDNKAWLSTGLDFDGSPVHASYKMSAHKAGQRSNVSDTSQASSNWQTVPMASSTTPTHNKAWPSSSRWEANASDIAWQASSDGGSPGSPAFTGRKNGTGNKKKNSTPKYTRTSPNLSLADFIVEAKPKKKGKSKINVSHERTPSKDHSINEEWQSIRTPSPVNTPDPAWVAKKDTKLATGTTKRIKPTNLATFGRVTPQDKNVFSFEKIPEVEFPSQNTQQQREILLVERMKLSTRVEPSDSRLLDKKVINARSASNKKESIELDVEVVTYKEELAILAKIYSSLIDNNLIRNIMSALYYIISIIIIRLDKLETSDTSRDATDDDCNMYFKTSHNCVFFAVNVLHLQNQLISVFDRGTIKLLFDNSRVKMFSPALIRKLSYILEQKNDRKHEYPRTTITNAGFVLDTDTRDNFISTSSFHTFRKQRDLFCNLLDTWKKEHTDPDFKYEKVLGDKIRRLHYMHTDPINSMHLARLLKNKLLQECIDSPVPTNRKQLPNVDAVKLNRLENRLTSKLSTSGFLSEPFPGNELFYRDFITTTNSHMFHRHLKDCLVAEILKLDEADFWPSEIENTETAVDPETRIKFITCLKSVRLLSKFLSFLESLPYRTESAVTPSTQIYNTQLELRQHFVPAINVEERIKLALKFGRLSITVPWVTEYVAMFDLVTLRLPYFLQLIQTLYKIHFADSVALGFMGRIEGPLMVKFCLGWLFELRHFPIESYSGWLRYQYYKISKQESVDDPPTFQCFVDQLDLVDENVLYTVCPYLYEIRSLLNSQLDNNTDRPGPAKYIRPITTNITDPDTEDKRRKKMESDMEELFFQNHPSSLRRLVDFVIERVASTCAKYVWTTMVPKYRENSIELFQNHLEHLNEYKFNRKQKAQSCCKVFSKSLAITKVDEMKIEFDEEMQRQVCNRCTGSIAALLADDLYKTVGSVAITIAKKHTHQKISVWFTTHMTPAVLFEQDLDAILAKVECDMKPTSSKSLPNRQGKKSIVNLCRETVAKNTIKASYNIPSLGRANIDHNPDVKSPTMFMIHTHQLVVKVADESHLVTYEELFANITEARLVFNSRCDFSAKVIYETCECYKRLAYLILVHVPGLLNSPILHHIMMFWRDFLLKKNYQNFFARFFSPLNVSLFINAPNPAATWDAAADFVLALVQEKFVTDHQIEEQAIAMFRFEWPDGTIMDFSRCLRKIVDERIRKTGRVDEYNCTLAWLASFIQDEDYF